MIACKGRTKVHRHATRLRPGDPTVPSEFQREREREREREKLICPDIHLSRRQAQVTPRPWNS